MPRTSAHLYIYGAKLHASQHFSWMGGFSPHIRLTDYLFKACKILLPPPANEVFLEFNPRLTTKQGCLSCCVEVEFREGGDDFQRFH